MSDPERPLPMTPEEEDRELEAFLARSGRVTAAWKDMQDAVQAPPELDAAVLANARAAVEARPAAPSLTIPTMTRPAESPYAAHRRLRRWRVPLAAAATLVFGVVLIGQWMRDPVARQQVVPVDLLPPSPPSAAEPAQEQYAASSPGSSVSSTSTPSVAAASDTAVPPSPAVTAANPALPVPSPPQKLASETTKKQKQPEPMAQANASAGIADDSAPLQEQMRKAAPPSPPVTSNAPVNAPAPAIAPSKPMASESKAAAIAAPAPAPPPAAAGASSGYTASTPAASAPAWRPARWQTLTLGSSAISQLIERLGAPDEDSDAGRSGLRLLRWDHGADARGPTAVYVDPARAVVTEVRVSLKPSLPLSAVLTGENLDGLSPRLQQPAARGCSMSTPLPSGAALDPTRYPLDFVYPDRGVVLSLPRAGVVSEIAWLERCE